ncbi:MAG TPA: IS91 family transposase [Terracidiphilus sp.]|jgi:Putative transposase/Transposase zinc-binding domain
MNRPPLEVADLVRAAGNAFLDRNRHWLSWKHVKVLLAIRRCRTAALGGHLDQCSRCGHQAISYNSCRNRHCPKCQTSARERWIAARQQELLPTPYAHIVFTLPRHLAPLVLQNRKLFYSLLFHASAETLLEVAQDPRHLGAEIGFFSVLHTWSQKLTLHPHVHCVVPAGGLSPDHSRWICSHKNFFLPKQILRRVFRGKFIAALKEVFQNGQLHFHGNLKLLAQPRIFAAWLRPLHRQDWVVYLKRPFGGPEYVLQYLGRYTHRVAISNHRLVAFTDGQVIFRWRDSAHQNQQKLMTLSLDEFLRRFLLHILPKGFIRIRHFGFLANRRRAALLPVCFDRLGVMQPASAESHSSTTEHSADLYPCPKCGEPMVIALRLTPAELQLRSPPELSVAA